MADTSESHEENKAAEELKLTDDGGVVKKILKKGEGWKTPTTGCDVKGVL